MTDEAHVIEPEGVATYETPQGEDVVVLARGDEPGEDYDLVELTIPQDPGVVPPHIHHDDDEAFYVLEGELLLQVGDEQHELTAGSYAFGPRGVPHAYQNTGDGPARLLIIYTPGSFVSMMDELAELGPIDLEDESDLERVMPIFESYGLEMAGSPPEEE
jgi:quercetin dioxygenase-like cupin family protein